MIKCHACGAENEYTAKSCSACGRAMSITEREAEEILATARAEMKARNYESAVEKIRALADIGFPEAAREWGAILERGALVPRDLDGAMKQFFVAAEAGDAYAAYRYSRLAFRTSERSARFWLAYAAVFGAREAYPAAAKMYSESGDEETAGYYYALAAECDDVEAIVTLARRYFDGIGTEKHPSYAKWYMDKLTLPPLYALRLAYKLRSVKAEEPPRPTLPSHEGLLRSLIRDAESYGLDRARLALTRLLAEDGTPDAVFMLARLLLLGIGAEKNLVEALRLLEDAAAHGSAEAASCLGDLFITDKDFPRDVERALFYYKKAAALGKGDAYETLGDIFCEGRLVSRDVAYAIELYTAGAREGEENSRKKARELIEQREAYFATAEVENRDPKKAYKCYAIAASMGHIPAYVPLASCFEHGVGVKRDRREAFLWYEAAAEAGDSDGMLELGRCYARGVGTAFNYKAAVENLNRAARIGVDGATEELLRLLGAKKKHMSRSLYSAAMRLLYQKKAREARRLLSAGVTLSHPEATYTLGCLCEFGIGGECDRERAFALYNDSFSLGFRDPRQRYKLIVLRMTR